MTQGSTVRDELHTLTLEEVTPAQFKTAIGKVYIGPAQEISTQVDCVSMVDSYRAVHTPTMGQSIPGSAEIASETAPDDNVFTVHKPAAGEVFQLNAAQLVNAHAANPSTVALLLTDGTSSVVISKVENAAPSAVTPRSAFGTRSRITYDNTVWIGAIVESGSDTDQTVSVASIKVVQ
jgi:ethanolamine ammonia-lyase small subunit